MFTISSFDRFRIHFENTPMSLKPEQKSLTQRIHCATSSPPSHYSSTSMTNTSGPASHEAAEGFANLFFLPGCQVLHVPLAGGKNTAAERWQWRQWRCIGEAPAGRGPPGIPNTTARRRESAEPPPTSTPLMRAWSYNWLMQPIRASFGIM